jgi:LuxR family maltose regulon positive regulatory protein
VPRRPSLDRPRLADRLRDRFAAPVSVIVAPAGFGKTTLLAQAVAESRLAADRTDRWLTCNADDAAGSALADGLCRAMGIPPLAATDRAVDAVAEAMWHRSPAEVVLVLDDVHEVPASSPGAEVLSRLVAALPGNGHVLFAGREPPPVALARLEVQGHVLRLGEADLRFTDEELAEFAAHRDVAAGRLAGSGGWPALAELAASAVPGVEAAYVWEEVLAALDSDRRRDLALLAHVGAFDDALATAALGRPVDLATLTADFPLVATTPSGVRQVHALWRPYLRAAVDDAEVAEARRRAGLELARSGDMAAAVRLLTDAGAWDDVSRVVVDALGADRPPVPGDLVTAWLGRLPSDMTDGSLARLLGAVGAGDTDPVAAGRDLGDAAATYRADGNQAAELACLAQLSQLAWWSEQHDRLVEVAGRLFEMEAAGYGAASPLACLARALIADVTNDSPRTLAELDRIPEGSLAEAWVGLIEWLRSTSLNHLGRPGEAYEAAERARAHADPLHAPVVESARLQALWFQGRNDEVLRAFPPLVERTEATGLRNYTALMAAGCCTLLAGAGRVGEAATHLERARRATTSPMIPLVDVNLAIAEATVRIASGDEAGAAAVLHDYLGRSAPLDTGLAAFPQRRTLAVWYVLVPDSRAAWDAADLGPAFAVARDLARAVVAVRRGGRPPRPGPEPPAPGVVRAHLPLPWATELALAQIAAGHAAGWQLLDALWPAAQPYVRRHAVRAGGDGPTGGDGHAGAPLGRPARTALARLPVPPPGRLELRLLGPVELVRDGVPVDAPDWRRERVRSLLAHLVLQRPVGRERLADDLWPALDADSQLHNLRVNLAHLLRVLEPERPERDASFLVRPHGGGLMLHRGEWFTADIWRFDDFWRRAVEADRDGAPAAALDAMRAAVALWRDDPSELAAESWAVAEVEERRLRVVTLAVRAGELLLASGEPDEARHLGAVALRVDPWSPRAHHVVVSALAALDDTAAARRALDRYRDTLTELGVRPADQARKLEPLARLLPLDAEPAHPV